jgi:hypothetical protein
MTTGRSPVSTSLQALSLRALREEYARLYGVTTTSSSKDYLRKRIAARRREVAVERGARSGGRDPRLPALGTVLAREQGGKTHRVKVAATGFEYARRTYRSLSAVAKAITGTNWNGFGFFGLRSAAQQEATS